MKIRIRKLLLDVHESCTSIELFLNQAMGNQRDFFVYRKNLMLKSAVERMLEIVGEAINRILKLNPDIQISQARKIVDFRNLLSHAYDSISDETVWGILIKNLPVLRDEVGVLLDSEFSETDFDADEN